MSAIVWRSSYSLGIQILDDQHKKLIAIINDLYEAHQLGTSKDFVYSALERVIDYTHYHFDAEEEILRENKYPNLEEHIIEHTIFRQHINNFLKETKNGNLLLSMKTIDYLKDWTINHILGSDKEYSDYLLDIELGK